MVRRIGAAAFLFLILVIFTGCAAWQYIGRPDTPWKNAGFDATLPTGWVKCNLSNQLLSLTKDGMLLEEISITRHNLNSDKEFPLSKKRIKDDMLIQEIADLVVGEMSLDKSGVFNLRVLENKPVNIGGMDGFRLEYTFNNGDFTKYKVIFYGFIFNKKFYDIRYTAASQHYFEANLKDFEEFVASFKVIIK